MFRKSHGTSWPNMPFSGAHNEDVPDRHIQMVLTHHPDAGPRVESLLKGFNEVRSSWSWLHNTWSWLSPMSHWIELSLKV
jgi:hypothetical protein